MILIDVVVGENIKDVVNTKLTELKKMQKANPVIQYQAFDNSKTREHMIDFLLSADAPDGEHIDVVERNVYCYKEFTDTTGKEGIVLFGFSTRSYGHDIYKFFADLKQNRYNMIKEVGDFTFPKITISK